MKERYINLMAKTLSAYTDEHIAAYFEKVKTNGLTEHGFPRLCANIGVLLSHGRRLDLLPIFREMMDFCCKTIPHVKAANDFSVREIVTCMTALEGCSLFTQEDFFRWKNGLKEVDPFETYNQFARTPNDRIFNWALFTGVSEYARQSIGLCDSSEFIDTQLATQLYWLDENKMYRDDPTRPPMVYDLVARSLFAILLHLGYRGKYYERIDMCLREAGLRTLDMLSVTGEIPYGGRSNQFLHNDSLLTITLEYEANRYQREGNLRLASLFKEARDRALDNLSLWLDRTPIRHIKNRFPTESFYGCETYAYFDKYMITAASWLYNAYLICDDSIPSAESRDLSPTVSQTSDHFHKVFLKCGNYSAEIDTNADPNHDASGLGRVHRAGAPSAICLSVPCPLNPKYKLDLPERVACALTPAALCEGEWMDACDGEATPYTLQKLSKTDVSAEAILSCQFPKKRSVTVEYSVTNEGVKITLSGDGCIGYMLPAFDFDGEKYTDITEEEHALTVSYEGYLCRYETDGKITSTDKRACNRNGYYRVFRAEGDRSLTVFITIKKKD